MSICQSPFIKTCCMDARREQVIRKKLQKYQVQLTQNRIAVFKLLTESKTAMSVSQIVKQPGISLDRISVYRALQCFYKKGIVEIVPNSKGNAKYILASSGKEVFKRSGTACAYLVCSGCQRTEQVLLPVNIRFSSLATFQINKYCLVAEGLCSKCK
jgi:Fe2+ or Zn2+ uptake regulation protein